MLYRFDFVNGKLLYGFLEGNGCEKSVYEFVNDVVIILSKSLILNKYLELT